MKLNPDCIRDILLYLEENLKYTNDLEPIVVDLDELNKYLPQSKEEIANTLIVLDEAYLIRAAVYYSEHRIEDICVERITYNGYQFLEHIRPVTVWNSVKEVSRKVGSSSLQAITQIATGVITQIIQTQLGLI